MYGLKEGRLREIKDIKRNGLKESLNQANFIRRSTYDEKKQKEILFCDYFDQWVETYKVGAIKQVTLNKYYMSGKQLRNICPKLLMSNFDRIEYQKSLTSMQKRTRNKLPLISTTQSRVASWTRFTMAYLIKRPDVSCCN